MSNYSNDPSRLLDKINRDAIAYASKAATYGERLTEAKAAVADAESLFFADLTDESAAALADAQRRVVDLTVVNVAIENGGGLEEVRARHLRTPAVFSTFAAGFAERASVIEKLVVPARKRLAQRRAILGEAGIPWQLIEHDPHVVALRAHEMTIAPALAESVFGKNYADKRGVGYESLSFNALYSKLTVPLPLPPSDPAV